MNITFTKGRPYTPLMQLLNVLPSQSGPFLPEPYRDLMVRFRFLCSVSLSGCPRVEGVLGVCMFFFGFFWV